MYMGNSGATEYAAASALAMKMAHEWQRKYCEAGKVTAELEAERMRIMRVMFEQKRQK
jgi:hypothetical protein